MQNFKKSFKRLAVLFLVISFLFPSASPIVSVALAQEASPAVIEESSSVNEVPTPTPDTDTLSAENPALTPDTNAPDVESLTPTPNTNASDISDTDSALEADKKAIPEEEPQMETMSVGEGESGSAGQSAVVRQQLAKSDAFSGALTYSYPITTPPGRNGMQPNLALSYTSQSANENGVFGLGWSVNIPYIERINRKGSDKLYTENYFYSSLTGELVNTSGSAYRAKVDNGDWLDFTFSSNTWLVKDKKGVTYKFGYQASTRQDDPNDSSKVYKWMLEEVRDLNNNYVKYEYYKDAGQIYPSVITYTGYNTTDGIFTVEFTRESRSDAVKSDKPGFAVTTNYRIKEIIAKISGTWARKYAIAFTTNDTGQLSIIDTITEYGKDETTGAEVSLPAVNFDYQTHGENLAQTASWDIPQDGLNSGAIIDVNGDGLVDIFQADYSYPNYYHYVWINDGYSGFIFNQSWSDAIPNNFALNSSGFNNTIADINGDQLPDLIKDSNPSHIYLNTGSGWQETSSWSLPTIICTNSLPHHFVDLNGDGLLDIFRSIYSIYGSVNEVYLNNGIDGWDLDEDWVFPSANVYLNDGYGADHGGRLIDANGDGLPDLIRQGQGNGVFINQGRGWVYDSTWSLPTESLDFSVNATQIADFNGDGLADLLKMSNTAGNYIKKMFINNGRTSWNYDSSWTLPDNFYFPLSGEYPYGKVLDFNGDNLPDLVRRSASWGNATYKNSGPKADLMKKITYPESGYTDIIYKPSAQYFDGSTKLNPNLPFIIDTVYQMTHSDNFGGSYGYTYNYEGGKYYYSDAFNRQFSGFHKVTQTDGSSNKNITYFHQGDSTDTTNGEYDDHVSKIGKIYRTETKDNSSNLYQVSVNKWERANIFKNSSFEQWSAGDTNPPDEWTASNLSAIAKESTEKKVGNYSVKMTMTSADERRIFQSRDEYAVAMRGKQVTFGAWVKTPRANDALIRLGDSAGNSQVWHSGSGNWEFLTVTRTIDANATSLWAGVVHNQVGSVYFDGTVLIEGSSIPSGYGNDYDFTKLTRATELDYDGNSGHKDKSTAYAYSDTTGNLTQKTDWGEVTASTDGSFTDTGSDKYIADLSYVTNATYHIYGLPSQETVTNQSAAKVKESKYYYDNLSLGNAEKGNLTKQEQWKSGTEYIDAETTYNSYGLATQTKDPNDNATNFTYDTYNLYPVTNTNAQNQTTTYAYDYSSGQVKETTDPNGGKVQTVRDGLDRVTEEKQSNPATPSTLETKAIYAYAYLSPGKKITKTDYLNDSTSNVSYVYYDGLNRLMQNRQETEGDSGDPYTVADTIYDSTGRLWKQSLPYISQGGGRTSPTTNTNAYTLYAYDALNRIASQTDAVGTVTNAYDDWKTTVTDARGKVKYYYNDAYGRLIKVDEINSGNTYTTQYEYDGNGNLTKITDALSNVRNFTYDGLSRRLTAEDLHATSDQVFGTWNYAYDAAGNLISTTDPKNQIVDYSYDALNRVKTETNSYAPDNNLVGYWDLDEGTGTIAYDLTPNANNGTLTNGPAWTSGISGQALDFDGTNDYVDNGTGTGTSLGNGVKNVSVSLWFKADVTNSNDGLFYLGNFGGTHGEINAWIQSNYIYMSLDGTAWTNATPFSDTTNWHHLVMTYDGVNGKLYLDGTNIISQPYASGLDMSGLKTIFGSYYWPDSTFFDGKIDEVRIYNKTLTQNEISALYSNPGGKEVVGYWDFDEGTGTTAHDLTPNTNNATLSNVSWVDGISGKAGSFNGTTSYGQITDDPAIQNIFDGGGSVSVWINPTSDGEGDNGRIMDKYGWFINNGYDSGGKAYLYFRMNFSTNYGWWRTNNRVINLNEINNITVTYNADSVSNDPIIYLNGTPVAITEYNTPVGTRETDVGRDLYIGSNYGNSGTFDGWIDEPKLFNKSLSAAEVYQLYQSTKEGDVSYAYDGCPNGIGRLCSVSKSGYAEASEYDALGRAKRQSKVIYNNQNLLKNSNFEQWSAGETHQFPDNWTATSYYDWSKNISQIKVGNASCEALSQPVGWRDLSQTIDWKDEYKGKTFTLGVWLKGASAHTADLLYQDGINTITHSVNITTDWQFFTWTFTISSSASKLMIQTYRTYQSSAVAYIDGAILVEGASIPNYQTDYAYDRLNNPTSVVNPDGSEAAYEYNYAGQLEKVKYKPSGGSFSYVVSDFDYAPTGQASYVAYANGVTTTNTYDADHLYRLSNKLTVTNTNAQHQNLTYTYDANGNVTQIADTSQTNAAKTANYVYDDLNRLSSATITNAANGQNYTRAYTYDAIGNITYASDLGSYSYAGTGYTNPHAATTIGSTSLSYDYNGNATANGAWTYNWDYNNKMTQATNGTLTETYAYDHAGQRVRQTNTNISTHYPTKNYSHDGANATRHIFAGDLLVATVDNLGTHYVHTDHLSGSSVVTNTNAQPEQLFDYYPYGGIRINQQKDLVGYWDFNEGAGSTASDKSGNGNSGTLTNMESADWVSGKSGKALDFDGANEYINIPLSFPMGSFSVAAWVRLSSSGTGERGIAGIDKSEGGYAMSNFGKDGSNSRWYFNVSNTSNNNFRAFGEVSTSDTWVYLVGTYDDSTKQLKMYQDGVPKGTNTLTGTRGTATGNFYVGSNRHGGGNASYWYGKLDEPRLYSKALTADEITALYQQTAGEKRQFTGTEKDQATDLNYMGSRYYLPTYGRFLSQDPVFLNLGDEAKVKEKAGMNQRIVLSNPQSLNSYSYSLNNPLTYRDPNGNFVPALIAIATFVAANPDFTAHLGLATWFGTKAIGDGVQAIASYIQGNEKEGNQHMDSMMDNLSITAMNAIGMLATGPTAEKSTIETTKDMQSQKQEKIHGNSLESKKVDHGYYLKDRESGETIKIGETANPKDRYSQTFFQNNNARMEVQTTGTKQEIHQWQHQQILEYKVQNDGQRPKLNKSDW